MQYTLGEIKTNMHIDIKIKINSSQDQVISNYDVLVTVTT